MSSNNHGRALRDTPQGATSTTSSGATSKVMAGARVPAPGEFRAVGRQPVHARTTARSDWQPRSCRNAPSMTAAAGEATPPFSPVVLGLRAPKRFSHPAPTLPAVLLHVDQQLPEQPQISDRGELQLAPGQRGHDAQHILCASPEPSLPVHPLVPGEILNPHLDAPRACGRAGQMLEDRHDVMMPAARSHVTMITAWGTATSGRWRADKFGKSVTSAGSGVLASRVRVSASPRHLARLPCAFPRVTAKAEDPTSVPLLGCH
jgi:hypothetical protein